MEEKLIIYSDGGAIKNPGPAGIGLVICDENRKILDKYSEYIGETTNNQAEYQAVIKGLEIAFSKYHPKSIDFYLDSQLVVEQLNRRYKIKNQGLASLFLKIHNLVVKIGNVRFFYIPREQNKEADKLVKKAIKEGMKNA